MGSSRAIRDALISVITPLQLNGEPAFTEVKGYAKGEFDGFPSVRVLPGDQSNEKGAIGQNDRSPAYIVRTHVPQKDDGSDINYLYDLTDLLLDALDEADFTNQLQIAGVNAYLLNASRGDWIESDSQSGPVLICDIDVSVTYSIDL